MKLAVLLLLALGAHASTSNGSAAAQAGARPHEPQAGAAGVGDPGVDLEGIILTAVFFEEAAQTAGLVPVSVGWRGADLKIEELIFLFLNLYCQSMCFKIG